MLTHPQPRWFSEVHSAMCKLLVWLNLFWVVEIYEKNLKRMVLIIKPLNDDMASILAART